MKRSDTFMRDEIRPAKHVHLSYWDGLRFGFGFLIANLLGLSLIAGLAFGIASLMNLA